MTSSAVTAATTPLPRPRAIDGAVENDISNRTLIVRRPKHMSGYEALRISAGLVPFMLLISAVG